MTCEPLFTYQKEDAQWLANRKYALLASEMGTGKSAITITATDIVHATSILVLCPAIARLNWMREWQKFSNRSLPCSVLLSAKSMLRGSGTVICSYDLLTKKNVWSALTRVHWQIVVLDEAHYLKNRNAKRTRAAFSLKSDRVWALSGTPAPNNFSEVYPLLHRFGAYTGSYWDFLRRFCQTIDTAYGTQIVGNQRSGELKQILAPLMLRRRKDDVLKDLPPILYTDVVVEPSPIDLERWFPEVMVRMKTEETLMREIAEEQAAIDAVVNLTGLGKDGLTALAGLNTKTSQTRRYVGLQKTPAIASIVKSELEAGAYDKIVLFAWHRDVIVDLQERLKDFHPLTLFGGTPPEKRDSHIRKFQNIPKHRVIICNIKAAGTAITLTAAHQIGMVECSYVPGDNAQAVMRVHRIGQGKPVTARFFSLADSTDEKVQRVLRRKTRDLTQLFDSPVPPVNPFED